MHPRAVRCFCCAIALGWTGPEATAAESPREVRRLTHEEIQAWLDESPMDGEQEGARDAQLAEAPPLPPRKHGLVVEGAVGSILHLSTLKYISPASPEFRALLGYEVIDPLLLFAEGGLWLASTRYAKEPPGPRTYAYYHFGGGARFSIDLAAMLAVYLQVSAGTASASEDVLVIYGYRNSNEFELFFGGQVGLEWLPVNPHYALAAHAGVRNYMGLARDFSDQAPMVVNAGLAIKYAF